MVAAERIPTYRPPIPDSLRERYENGLSGVERWKNQLLPPSIPENDLQHVNRMLLMLEDIGQRFPNISSEVSLETTAHMIYIHDGGEIISQDLSRAHLDYEKIRPRHKRKERLGFGLIIAGQIEDVELKAYVRKLYKRVEDKLPDDKEAQLTDFIDKAQAVRFGLANVFHGEMMRSPKRKEMQLNRTIGIFLPPIQGFYNSLNSPDSKKEAKEMIMSELSRFRTHGYKGPEIKPHVTRMETIFS